VLAFKVAKEPQLITRGFSLRQKVHIYTRERGAPPALLYECDSFSLACELTMSNFFCEIAVFYYTCSKLMYIETHTTKGAGTRAYKSDVTLWNLFSASFKDIRMNNIV